MNGNDEGIISYKIEEDSQILFSIFDRTPDLDYINEIISILEKESKYKQDELVSIFGEGYNFPEEKDKIDLIINIGNCLDEMGKYEFIESYDDNKFCKKRLENLFTIVSFLNQYKVDDYIANLMHLTISDENISYLMKNIVPKLFSLSNSYKINLFKNTLFSYIQTDNESVFNGFFEAKCNLEFEVNHDIIDNDFDMYILEILDSSDKEKIIDLGKNIDRFISELRNSLILPEISSTGNNNNGSGCGNYAKVIKQVLSLLLKSNSENYFDYMKRVYLFSWEGLFYSHENDRRTGTILKLLGNKNRYIYSNIIYFKNSIIKMEENKRVDLSKLEEKFSLLINEKSKYIIN